MKKDEWPSDARVFNLRGKDTEKAFAEISLLYTVTEANMPPLFDWQDDPDLATEWKVSER